MSQNDFRAYANYCDEIYHHGILGQKWGVRRYQNPDGSLTPEGEKRYGKKLDKLSKKVRADISKNRVDMYVDAHNRTVKELHDNDFFNKFNDKWHEEFKKNGHMDKNGKLDYRSETYGRYTEDYENIFDSLYERNLAKVEKEFYQNNKNYQAAYEFYKKYPVKKFEQDYGESMWKSLEEDCNRYIKEFDDYYANRKER